MINWFQLSRCHRSVKIVWLVFSMHLYIWESLRLLGRLVITFNFNFVLIFIVLIIFLLSFIFIVKCKKQVLSYIGLWHWIVGIGMKIRFIHIPSWVLFLPFFPFFTQVLLLFRSSRALENEDVADIVNIFNDLRSGSSVLNSKVVLVEPIKIPRGTSLVYKSFILIEISPFKARWVANLLCFSRTVHKFGSDLGWVK